MSSRAARPGPGGRTALGKLHKLPGTWNPAGPARQNDRMPPADDIALASSTAPDTAAGPAAVASTPAAGDTAGRDLDALRDVCTRFLHSHGPVRAADLLATVPTDTVPDRYGEGGVVAELEAEI